MAPDITRSTSLGSRSRPGEGTRLEFEVEPGAARARRPALRGSTDGRSGAARRLAHRGRLRAAAALRRRARRSLRALPRGRRGSRSRSTRARSTSRPPRTRSCEPLRQRGRRSTSPPGRTTRSRWRCRQQILCRPDCAGLCPVCGESLNDAPAGAHDHEPRARPALGEAARAAVRVGRRSRYHPRARHGRPEEENLIERAATSAARTHKAATPRLNECPRCHSPRLPHRVCPVCGTYAGREVIAPGDRRARAPRAARRSSAR